MREVTDSKNLNITLIGVKGVHNALDNFPMEMADVSIDFKIGQMLEILNDCYCKTKSEIAEMFTIDEAWFLIGAFRGQLYTSTLDDKKVLLSSIKDAIFEESLDEMLGINGEEVLRKAEKLTQFQSFCVIRQAYEAYYLKGGGKQAIIDSSVDNEKIKRIFGIK